MNFDRKSILEVFFGFRKCCIIADLICLSFDENFNWQAKEKLGSKSDCHGDVLYTIIWTCISVQWNSFTPDTIGTTVIVLISGVSLFQGLILYTFVCICGKTKCLDLRGVRI